MYHISWNVSFPHKISIFSITFSIVMSKHSFFPSNCPILLYICSFAMACRESSYSTICSYLFLIFYNREMSRNKTNSYEMKSNYARFQILEPSKTIHTEQFVVLDAISSLIDHQPKKTHFVELFYYFHFSFDIDYSFYVVSETNVLLWSRSPKPKWYVKLFSSLNFKWLTTTHRCVLLKFYKMLFLFVFFTYQQKYCFNTKQNTK